MTDALDNPGRDLAKPSCAHTRCGYDVTARLAICDDCGAVMTLTEILPTTALNTNGLGGPGVGAIGGDGGAVAHDRNLIGEPQHVLPQKYGRFADAHR